MSSIPASGLDLELERLGALWESHWPGVPVRSLREDVERRLHAAIDGWSLDQVEPLSGGMVSLVVGVRSGEEDLVLKLTPSRTPDEDELQREGPALASWAPTGVVPKVHAIGEDGLTLLIERIRPGRTLDDAALSHERHLEVLGSLARRLHELGSPPQGFLAVEDFVLPWRRYLGDGAPEQAELDRLLRTTARRAPLHGDLHGANALGDGEDWRVIDPYAVAGDPNLDCWALIDPLAPELPDDDPSAAARERVRTVSAAASLDPERVAAWTRVRARAQAREYELDPTSDDSERAWAGRLHRFADALGPSS